MTGSYTWPTKSAYFAWGLYNFDVSFSSLLSILNCLLWLSGLNSKHRVSLFCWTVAQGLGELIGLYYNEKDLKQLKKAALCIPCPNWLDSCSGQQHSTWSDSSASSCLLWDYASSVLLSTNIHLFCSPPHFHPANVYNAREVLWPLFTLHSILASPNLPGVAAMVKTIPFY